jgi:hypothetical protein
MIKESFESDPRTLIEFPWTERWLNGTEYEHMIKWHEDYIMNLGLQIYVDHPVIIYTSPSHGLIYYLKNQSLRELGFPRVKGLKKRFKWKKMNFVTNLPKQKPQVTYLVATGKLGQSCYRMHIVFYNKNFPILCHMLRIQNQLKVGIGIPSRQHFKENIPLPPPPLTQPKTRPASDSSSRKLHPLELEALMCITAPFKSLSSHIAPNSNV